MIGFLKVSLGALIEEAGEDTAKKLLSGFSCPLNKDVEIFLRYKAIEFEKQQLSKTKLIFTSYQEETVLVAYYTLASKSFNVSKTSLTKTMRKRIAKFATYDAGLKAHIMPAPLIAQLGKNFTNDYHKLITGDELLKMACDDVQLVQDIVGGKIVYLECEDCPKLLDFYGSNGFVPFDKRELDADETNITGSYLVQMLKVLQKRRIKAVY